MTVSTHDTDWTHGPILIVDDSSSHRFMLRKTLERWGYSVTEAPDAETALAMIRTDPVRLVISDWVMPGMQGPELCDRIRALMGDDYIYVILLTSRSASDDVAFAYDSGADDFLIKPLVPRDLAGRLKGARRILTLQHDLQDKHERLLATKIDMEKAFRALQADLDAAERLQRSMLPAAKSTALNAEIATFFQPAAHLAGDIFNFAPVQGRYVALYCIDVSGHGVSSALLSVSLSKVLEARSMANEVVFEPEGLRGGVRPRDPVDVVETLNSRFQAEDNGDLYFTMVYGILDTHTGVLSFCQAGHPAPLLVRANGEAEYVSDTGMPVGMLLEASFGQCEVRLREGDQLYFYTDGIVECEGPSGVMLGDDRFLDVVARSAPNGIDATVEAIEALLKGWRQQDTFDDDISVLALRMGGADARMASHGKGA